MGKKNVKPILTFKDMYVFNGRQKLALAPIMQDDFSGTFIDADKWTVVNSGGPNFLISQNDKLIMRQDTSTGVSPYLDYVWSENYEILEKGIISFKAYTLGARPEISARFIGADNLGDFTPTSSGGEVIQLRKLNSTQIEFRVFSSLDDFSVSQTIDIVYNQRYKIIYDNGDLGGVNGDISLYYWNNGWVKLGNSVNKIFRMPLRPQFLNIRNQGTINQYEFTEFYMTDFDYETETP